MAVLEYDLRLTNVSEVQEALEVYAIVKKFIQDNKVSCPEATTNDSVYENAPELVYDLAEIVGYYEYE